MDNLKENAATKAELVAVGGRLDTILERMVSKDDLKSDRRYWLTTAIAGGVLIIGALSFLSYTLFRLLQTAS